VQESTGLCLDLTTLTARYAAGATIPSEIVRIVYRRIPEYLSNPIWITLRREEDVLGEALALEARVPDRGPLYGLPFAVKDNLDCAGLPTTAACPALTYTPATSAHAVRRLQDAGALLIGKTNLDQLATGLTGTRSPYGACRNLFDDRYIAGGSSSGSALSVAAGLVSFALGTDTAGSGRVPAAFNNIVGLKPTRGLVGTRGLVPACRSLDCVSVFAVSSADALAVLRVLAGYDAEDPYSRPDASVIGLSSVTPPACFRFGIPSELEFFGNGEAERLFHAALRRLETLGGTPIEIDFVPPGGRATPLRRSLARRATRSRDSFLRPTRPRVPAISRPMAAGARISPPEAGRDADPGTIAIHEASAVTQAHVRNHYGRH
jgi:allophanate hydrolase